MDKRLSDYKEQGKQANFPPEKASAVHPEISGGIEAEDTLTVLFQVVSYLLQYPGETWEDDLSFLRCLLEILPESAAAPLNVF